jgi:hypothetical protein
MPTPAKRLSTAATICAFSPATSGSMSGRPAWISLFFAAAAALFERRDVE